MAKKNVSTKIQKIIKDNQGIRLDIGCGGNKQEGFVGMDIRAMKGVDIVQDLEKFPWGLPNDCVTVAIASHVVEHINPAGGTFIRFLNEVWRILKPGAEFMIAAPYYSSPGFAQDPTHCNMVSEVTWEYFDPLAPITKGQLYHIYSPLPWKIKVNTWSNNGNLECVLVKRLIDKSYGVSEEFLKNIK